MIIDKRGIDFQESKKTQKEGPGVSFSLHFGAYFGTFVDLLSFLALLLSIQKNIIFSVSHGAEIVDFGWAGQYERNEGSGADGLAREGYLISDI